MALIDNLHGEEPGYEATIQLIHAHLTMQHCIPLVVIQDSIQISVGSPVHKSGPESSFYDNFRPSEVSSDQWLESHEMKMPFSKLIHAT